MQTRPLKFIDPKLLARLENLQLLARTVVEGFVVGLHRSPFHGISLDFEEYREYSPGDDIRSVDWKVYGRTERFYIKKFEGDTNTQLHILLDTSRSMSFSSGGLSKFDYARFLAASLAYFGLRQSDLTGLAVFDSGIRDAVPARSQHRHFLSILHLLEGIQPGGESHISEALGQLSNLIRKKSMVVLISDCYQDVHELLRALRFLHHRGNDIILFHVLDPLELDLSLEDGGTFEDMETGEQLPYVPADSRQNYLDLLEHHIRNLRRECRDTFIDYQLLSTEEPLDLALKSYLMVRQRRY